MQWVIVDWMKNLNYKEPLNKKAFPFYILAYHHQTVSWSIVFSYVVEWNNNALDQFQRIHYLHTIWLGANLRPIISWYFLNKITRWYSINITPIAIHNTDFSTILKVLYLISQEISDYLHIFVNDKFRFGLKRKVEVWQEV